MRPLVSAAIKEPLKATGAVLPTLSPPDHHRRLLDGLHRYYTGGRQIEKKPPDHGWELGAIPQPANPARKSALLGERW